MVALPTPARDATSGQLPPDTRRQPALAGDEIARLVVNLSAPQIVHSATTRPRGPNKTVVADGTGPTGRIRAVIRHGDLGLGSAVDRPADLGTDPIKNPVGTPYLRQSAGPDPDVLDKYVNARSILPAATEGQGYPRLPRYHQLSSQDVMGTDLCAPFEGGQ